MYTVAFYSFKGGVGRSMALVNVAVELTKRGRRVLLVDFDLEAPGLDTFRLIGSQTDHRGIVDFICDYRSGFEVPDVQQYVYESPVVGATGGLWVMPAGRQDDEYDQRFKSIDWNKLYGEEDGFLLFEDLKAQWEQAIHPDYVLIDSRTGHTDIGGICTRQLPDAVVLLFFPNEQNRRGLEAVVNQVRAEERGPLSKSIQLHFVMANVPDLDDEQEILAANAGRFRETLKYDKLTATIHHYNSLALLDQAIFAVDHPRSRLAREYRELAAAIVRKNLEDRDGAIEFLDELLQRGRTREVTSSIETRLQELRSLHSRDAEVLRRLARLRRRQRRTDEALSLVDQALSSSPGASDLLLARAELRSSLGNREGALADAKSLLESTVASTDELTIVLRLLRELQPDLVGTVATSPALAKAEVDLEFIQELQCSLETLPVAETLLRKWLGTEITPSSDENITLMLSLVLIGEGKFSDAKETIHKHASGEDLNIYDAFNLAMAEWGASGTLRRDLFKRVLELHAQRSASVTTANYLQCIALASWVIGDQSGANYLAEIALQRTRSNRQWGFSAWSYLNVSPERFVDEIEEMNRMIDGKEVRPRFIARNRPVVQ